MGRGAWGRGGEEGGILNEAERALVIALTRGRAIEPQALQRALRRLPDQPNLYRSLQVGGEVEPALLDIVCGELQLELLRCACGAEWLARSGAASCSRCSRPGQPALGRIAGYRILREVARGGMGRVYQAVDEALGRTVALKLLDGAGDDPLRRARFEQEARVAARLEHEGIIRIHQAGCDPALGCFIAMAWIDGPTLAAAAPSMSVEERLLALEQVAAAVAHAHAHGVVHRDLKPANVLLDGPRAVVVDFGLALDAEETTRLTRTGMVLGTIRYMAPEQVLARRDCIGPPADVWALGVMLYELVAGSPLFEGQSAEQVYDAILAGAPPPALDGLPAPLAPVCRKALAPRREQRYPDAAAFHDELVRYREGRPVAARPVSTLGRLTPRRRPVLLCVALLLAGLLGLDLFRRRSRAVPQRSRPRSVDRRSDRELARAAARLRAISGRLEQIRLQYYLPQSSPQELRAELDRLSARLIGIDSAEAWRLLGLARHLAGDLDGAQQALERAVALAPRDGAILDRLARVHLDRALLLNNIGRVRRQQVARSIAQGLSVLRAPRDDGDPAPLDQHIARAYRSLAERRHAALEQLCREGLSRFDGVPGREVFHMLLTEVLEGPPRLAACDAGLAIRPHDAWLHFIRGAALHTAGKLREAIADYDRAIAINPRLLHAYSNRAVARRAAGDLRGALADNDRAIALDPRDAVARANRANAWKQAGKLDRARADYEAAIALDPSYPDPHHNLGHLELLERRYPAAIARLTRALELGYDEPALAYWNRGLARLAQGDPSSALADYDAALRANPRFVEALRARARVHLQQKRHALALADIDRAIALQPRKSDHHYQRGLLRHLQGDHRGAEADYSRAIALDPRNGDAYNNRGVVRRLLGAPAGAIADYTTALGLSPRDPELYANRGNARRDLRQLAAAEADYDRAIRLAPQRVSFYEMRGIIRQERGRQAEAIRDFTTYLGAQPHSAEVLARRGMAHRALGDLRRALADYERAMQLAPRWGALYNNRGNIRRQQGYLTHALADYSKAIELDPRLHKALHSRGHLLLESGRTAGAIADFERCVQLEPRAAEYLCDLGQALLAAGRAAEGRAALARALPLADPAQRRRIEALLAKQAR